jgi:hypothetical protein
MKAIHRLSREVAEHYSYNLAGVKMPWREPHFLFK